MTRYFSAAETAKLVRADLKTAFPGVKFSVTSSTYSMGSHVNVRWTDGPATKAVQRVTNRYRGSGIVDNTDYMPTQYRMYNGEEVHFSDTSCERRYSPALMQQVGNRVARAHGLDPAPQWTERGWSDDPKIGPEWRHDWFSQAVWRECERTHIVSRAEMAGYVAPPLEAHPITHEA